MKQYRRVQDLTKTSVYGNDGRLGTVKELYFDDYNWTVRYLVMRTGGWLMGRDVPIAPVAIADMDDANASMRINLQRKQIEQSPSIGRPEAIPRQSEEAYYKHYQWQPYWQPDTPEWGNPIVFLDDATMIINKPLLPESSEQSSIRSSAEITGYGIYAMNSEIGHLDDLVINDEDWRIQYIQVDARNWLPGKKVLVPTGRIRQIDWASRSVSVSLTRHTIESAPAYDPLNLITRDYEVALSQYYEEHGT